MPLALCACYFEVKDGWMVQIFTQPTAKLFLNNNLF
jgi:hypothetical protein